MPHKPDEITPYNDLVYRAELWRVDVPTRTRTRYTENDVRYFLTGTPEATNEPPNAELVWLADPPNATSEDYLVSVPGVKLTPPALEAIKVEEDGVEVIYLVVESLTSRSNRVVARLRYEPLREVVPR